VGPEFPIQGDLAFDCHPLPDVDGGALGDRGLVSVGIWIQTKTTSVSRIWLLVVLMTLALRCDQRPVSVGANTISLKRNIVK